MRFPLFAAFALAAVSSLHAQDFGLATPIAGGWSYAATADGSEASFANTTGNLQLWVNCTRSTRRVSIVKPASAAAPVLNVWTNSLTRSVASSFNPATGRLTIDLDANDPLLDAIANSRGRVAFSIAGQPTLVVPAWAETARVIEDCRG